MSEERITTTSQRSEDVSLDTTLRPRTLKEYVGQEQIKENLDIFMRAAKQRGEPIEHVLLYGPPGLGKTSLAYIIAREMESSIRVTSGPSIERAGDLAALLTNLQEGDILFIDEIHRMNKSVEEILYPAMEDYALDLIVGKGPGARTLRLDLPKFTLVGATTRLSMLSSPLRDRFGNTFRLNFYALNEIERIVNRSANILNIDIVTEAAEELASRSRATPRVANRLLKRVRDYAQVKGDGIIDIDICAAALESMMVDEEGLDDIDRRLLETIIDKFSGGPVGLNTLSAAISEEMATIEDIYEPFLMQMGFLARTPRGRVATDRAYEHLRKKMPQNKLEL